MVARRSRTLDATPAQLWEIVGSPRRLADWWPRVERVEGVARGGFTELLRSDKGAIVRADFRVVQRSSPNLIRWEQDLEGTPFGGLLKASETTITLTPEGGGTKVTIRLAQRLQGVSRFGGPLVRRAGMRQLSEALERLGRLV